MAYIPWLDHFGCRYVVHGDDVTTDASGHDCYAEVKAAGRFRIVKRTPGISTTDLVGRMLLCTKQHYIEHLGDLLRSDQEMMDRVKMYATDGTGLAPGSDVWDWQGRECVRMVEGVGPKVRRGDPDSPRSRR